MAEIHSVSLSSIEGGGYELEITYIDRAWESFKTINIEIDNFKDLKKISDVIPRFQEIPQDCIDPESPVTEGLIKAFNKHRKEMEGVFEKKQENDIDDNLIKVKKHFAPVTIKLENEKAGDLFISLLDAALKHCDEAFKSYESFEYGEVDKYNDVHYEALRLKEEISG